MVISGHLQSQLPAKPVRARSLPNNAVPPKGMHRVSSQVTLPGLPLTGRPQASRSEHQVSFAIIPSQTPFYLPITIQMLAFAKARLRGCVPIKLGMLYQNCLCIHAGILMEVNQSVQRSHNEANLFCGIGTCLVMAGKSTSVWPCCFGGRHIRQRDKQAIDSKPFSRQQATGHTLPSAAGQGVWSICLPENSAWRPYFASKLHSTLN